MAAPVNDLSRGCSVDDVYKMVAIAANQAIGLKSVK
jgi:phosphate acetyltransferase